MVPQCQILQNEDCLSISTIHFPIWILSEFLIRRKGSFLIWPLLLFPHYPFAILPPFFWGWGEGDKHSLHVPASQLLHMLHSLPGTLPSTCHLVNSFSTFKCGPQSLSKDLSNPLIPPTTSDSLPVLMCTLLHTYLCGWDQAVPALRVLSSTKHTAKNLSAFPVLHVTSHAPLHVLGQKY